MAWNPPVYDRSLYQRGEGESPRPRLRTAKEVNEAALFFDDLVSYNRYQAMLWQIQIGERRVVTDEQYRELTKQNSNPYGKLVSKKTLEDAARNFAVIAARLGPENLRPLNELEWGMVLGKLSAVRWMGGDGWDDLDT